MKKAFNLSDLIARKIKGSLTPEENRRLESWLQEDTDNKDFLDKVQQDEQLLEKLETYNRFDPEKAWEEVNQRTANAKTIRFIPTGWLRYAAIFIPILLVAAATLFFLNENQNKEILAVDQQIKPGTEKATLILSDGSAVELGESSTLKEIEQQGINIISNLKSLTYSNNNAVSKTEEIAYNELITPKGGTYRLTLADNSSIILNAGSSLRYPVVFDDEKREVYLSGEAYFEVQHDGRPFSVVCEGMDVNVLETTFNVEAYKDEPFIKTTLVEGKVEVVSETEPENKEVLAPSDQSVYDPQENRFEVQQVNTSQYTSWIDGKFEFNKDNLAAVMLELSRWYDFEYEFQNESAKDYHFTARITNDQEISTILDMLEMTANVKFEIIDQKIIVH
jgi:transmembrane sensor